LSYRKQLGKIHGLPHPDIPSRKPKRPGQEGRMILVRWMRTNKQLVADEWAMAITEDEADEKWTESFGNFKQLMKSCRVR
jgi:hypothetical protein